MHQGTFSRLFSLQSRTTTILYLISPVPVLLHPGAFSFTQYGAMHSIHQALTLSLDVCGVPSAKVHSYRVLQKAISANGTTAALNYRNNHNCTADSTDESPNPVLAKRIKHRHQLRLRTITYLGPTLSSQAWLQRLPSRCISLSNLSARLYIGTATSASRNRSAEAFYIAIRLGLTCFLAPQETSVSSLLVDISKFSH